MRVSISLVSALVALVHAGPCRPRPSSTTEALTTTESALTSETTDVIPSTSTKLVEETTSTILVETTTTETSEASYTFPTVTSDTTITTITTTAFTETTLTYEASETVSSTVLGETTTETDLFETTTTSEATESASSATTSVEVSTTETAAETTTTSEVPVPTTKISGFCLRAVTRDAPNYNNHVGATYGPGSDLMIRGQSSSSFGFFSWDSSTRALTIDKHPSWNRYQVFVPSPLEGQINRALQIARPAAVGSGAPLLCENPEGVYESGSILKCSATTGGSKKYLGFGSGTSSAIGTWSVYSENYAGAGGYKYDVAIFFGEDCRIN